MRWRKAIAFAVAVVLIAALIDISFFWNVINMGVRHTAPELEYDTAGAVWGNAWIAHAISHLDNPFFSANLMHPFGLNLLANAYNVGMSAVFAPVTWVAGPIAATNLQLMADPIVDALVMGLCLRSVVRNDWIAAAGGLMWGFSPFVEAAVAKGWTNVAFLVAPPLLFWLLYELVERKRWSARRIGILAGLVVIVQYFIDSELLIITAIGLVGAAAAMLIQRHGHLRDELPHYLKALAYGVGLACVVLAAPVAYGIFGPHPTPAWVRSPATFRTFVSPLIGVISAPKNPTLPPNFLFSRTANPAYIGAGVLAVLVLAIVVWRLRSWRLPLFLTGLVGLWLSVGYGPWWSPFPLIEKIPVLHNVTVTRFIVLAWFAAIVLVADAAAQAFEWVKHRDHRIVAVCGAAVIIAAGFAPPAIAVAQTLPLSASGTTVDGALAYVLDQSGPHVVMDFPFPASVTEMLEQAQEGNFSFSMPGGEWPQIFDAPEPATTVNTNLLYAGMDRLSTPQSVQQLSQLAQWITKWGVTDVIIPKSWVRADVAAYDSPRQFTALITEVLGMPRTVAGEWVWTRVSPLTAPLVLTGAEWQRCARNLTTPLKDVPACVDAAAAPS
jgi:hypothetical protein